MYLLFIESSAVCLKLNFYYVLIVSSAVEKDKNDVII